MSGDERPTGGILGARGRRSVPRIPRLRLRKPPGTAPGTLSVDPQAPPPVVTVMAYGPDDVVERPIDSLDDLSAMREAWPVIWVNVDGLGDHNVLTRIGEIFEVHPLALEDVTHVSQRAKVEPYEHNLFLVARMARLVEQSGAARLDTEQISMFVGQRYLLTIQERVGDDFDLVRQRIRSGRPVIRRSGPSYLAYALIDALVDAYFPVLESYSERLEALEQRVVDEPTPGTAAEIHAVKRELLRIRRAIWPHREAVSALLRDDFPEVAEETRVFLRDCYDHVVQIIDMVETYREIASSLMDLYLSSVSNRMNEIMKVLTIFAALFIPLTFVAGIYGMNFDTSSPWNLPELNWRLGYPFVLGLMATLAVTLLLYFRWKGWIGVRRPKVPGRGEP